MLLLALLPWMILGEFRVPFTQSKTHRLILEKSIQNYAPKLMLSSCEKENCVYAKEDISLGEQVISLPMTSVLSCLDKTGFEIPGMIGDHQLLLNIVYYKFIEKQPSLKGAAVHSAPIEFHVPLNWTEREISSYNTLSLFQFPITTNFNHSRFCELVNEKLDSRRTELPAPIFECETWKWAYMVIQTRTYAIKTDSYRELGQFVDMRYKNVTNINTLIPILDMINHQDRKKKDKMINYITFALGDPHRINFSALRDISSQEEVFSRYGSLNSFYLMTKYGFVLQNNLDDGIDMSSNDHIICRGTEEGDRCNYHLPVYSIDVEYLAYLTDFKTNGDLSERLKALIDALLFRSERVDVSDEEFDILKYASFSYRFDLSSFYEKSSTVSLRSMRRTFTNSDGYRGKLIYDYCEIERKIYFEVLKQIDRSILFLLHSSLF